MSVTLGSTVAIAIRRATVRFSTPAVASMTSVTKKMKGNNHDTDEYPNPVLCQPSHI